MSRLELTLDIKPNAIGAKRINARASLTVANLVTIIKDKFNIDSDLALLRANSKTPLRAEQTLEQVGIGDGETLSVMRLGRPTGTADAIASGARKPFTKRFQRAYFVEADSLNEHDLLWWPAVLGRRDVGNPARNRLLAVDLHESTHAATVSRHHAVVVEKDGGHWLEVIQAKSPVYINGTRVRAGDQVLLKPGAEITLGSANLTYKFQG